MTLMHIVQITDTTDRNARLKIESAYVNYADRYGLIPHISVEGATNSVSIGTTASELVNNTERPRRLILALNCAPPSKAEGTTNNARNDFFCANLKSGVTVCGTSNGLEFSYLKDQIDTFYRLTNSNSLGSQFRSLQILPQHAILFSIPEKRRELVYNGILKPVSDLDSIVPSIPDLTHVFEVDNFGNVKLVPSTLDRALLQKHEGQEIRFAFLQANIEVSQNLNGHSTHSDGHTAIVAPTLFAAPLGTNVTALTSSSKLAGNKDVPVIATIRKDPGDTKPKFPLPSVGDLVKFTYPSVSL